MIFNYNVLNGIGFTTALDNFTKIGTVEGSEEILDLVLTAVLTNTDATGGTASGSKADAERMISLIGGIKKKLLEEDMAVFNILHYLNLITKSAAGKLPQILSSLTSPYPANHPHSTPQDAFIRKLRDTQEGADLLQTMTRDQIALSGAMRYGLKHLSEKYPYIPTTQVINQGMVDNLMAFFSTSGFTDPEKKYRILVVGLPAGMVEGLRQKTVNNTGDSFYSDTTMIRLHVHRRNLVNSYVQSRPLIFPLDMSAHIIQGNRNIVSSDPTVSPPIPQTASALRGRTYFLNFSMKPDPSGTGIISTVIDPRKDYMYPQGGLSALTALPVGGPRATVNHITNNNMGDYYLKMYLKLLMGIDVSEGTFMLTPDTSLYNGPDPESMSQFSDLLNRAKKFSAFKGKSQSAHLEFSRLSGEISRSALFNSQRYKNQITGTKIFDRVFCILIDENDPTFELGQSSDAGGSGDGVETSTGIAASTSPVIDPNEPTYYQFFVTADLVKSFDVPGQQVTGGPDTRISSTGEEVLARGDEEF